MFSVLNHSTKSMRGACYSRKFPCRAALVLVRCGSIGQGVAIRFVRQNQTGWGPLLAHDEVRGRAAFQSALICWLCPVQKEYAEQAAQSPGDYTIVLVFLTWC